MRSILTKSDVLSFSATGGKCLECVFKFYTVIQVSIKYHDNSKCHYHPALVYIYIIIIYIYIYIYIMCIYNDGVNTR